jgi:hypothetical protein
LSDVEIITEAEYVERVSRLNRALPPLIGDEPEPDLVFSPQPGSAAECSLAERTAAARELIATILLSHRGTGQRELLVQLGFLRVVAGPVTFMEMVVDGGAPAAPISDGPVPGTVWVHDSDGRTVGTLVLWVRGGYLAALEYECMSAERPDGLPRREYLRTESA